MASREAPSWRRLVGCVGSWRRWEPGEGGVFICDDEGLHQIRPGGKELLGEGRQDLPPLADLASALREEAPTVYLLAFSVRAKHPR